MKTIFIKLICILGTVTMSTLAECPLSTNPENVAKCLHHLTSVALGVALNDKKMMCSAAAEIATCTQLELGECVAANFGFEALEQIRLIALHCCPDRNKPRCPIKDSIIKDQRCFAADSIVTLTNGKRKSIVDLQSGDSILAYHDETKRIRSTNLLTMLDFEPHRFALFKQVTTNTGRQLSLTGSHLLPTDTDGYIMAKDLRTGMSVFVMDTDGSLVVETVSNVTDVVKQGYVAPLTDEGTLIVNDIAVSCYATIKSHDIAHTILAPMRWWYRLFGSWNSVDESVGIHWFPKMLYDMTSFLLPSILH